MKASASTRSPLRRWISASAEGGHRGLARRPVQQLAIERDDLAVVAQLEERALETIEDEVGVLRGLEGHVAPVIHRLVHAPFRLFHVPEIELGEQAFRVELEGFLEVLARLLGPPDGQLLRSTNPG